MVLSKMATVAILALGVDGRRHLDDTINNIGMKRAKVVSAS
jgi:hypothetical protein